MLYTLWVDDWADFRPDKAKWTLAEDMADFRNFTGLQRPQILDTPDTFHSSSRI